MYHYVCLAKYRRNVFIKVVDNSLKYVCLETSKRFQIYILELGTDDNHVHFLVQSIPMLSPTHINTIMKSISAREVFRFNFNKTLFVCTT